MSRAAVVFPNYVPAGDSLTQGYYATTQANSFAYKLQGLMQGLNSSNATFINSNGVYGGKLADGLSSVNTLNGYLPDVITFEYGTNDAGNNPSPTPTATFQNQLNNFITSLTTGASATGRYPLIIFVTTWNQYAVGDPYDTIIKNTAATNGYPVVDVNALYKNGANIGPAGISTWNGTSDTFHPNNTGHQAIANAIWSVLQPYMKSAWRQTASSRSIVSSRSTVPNRAIA